MQCGKKEIKQRAFFGGLVRSVIINTARRYEKKIPSYMGLEFEDLVQIGLEVAFKAYRAYDPQKKASWKTFLILCLRNRYSSILRESLAGMRKHIPVDIEDIDEPATDGGSERVIVAQTIKKIASRLDASEKRMVRELMDGYTFLQAAHRQGLYGQRVLQTQKRLQEQFSPLLA